MKLKIFNNHKGFTLTEIIAVIILLSIIIVIASASVTTHLVKNKKRVSIRSAQGYVKAINDNNYINDPDKNISSGSVTTINPKLKNQISGELPVGGTVTIDSATKEVSSADLHFNGYIVHYNGNKYTISGTY